MTSAHRPARREGDEPGPFASSVGAPRLIERRGNNGGVPRPYTGRFSGTSPTVADRDRLGGGPTPPKGHRRISAAADDAVVVEERLAHPQ